MTTDEQLKKDTLWDIHVADKKIACLERRATIVLDAMREIVELWDKNKLTARDGYFAAHQNDISLRRLASDPNMVELTTALQELDETRSQRNKLQQSFDRM